MTNSMVYTANQQLSAQVHCSLPGTQAPAGSVLPAPKENPQLHTRFGLAVKGHDYDYVVDIGGHSGILVRITGEMLLRGVGKRKPSIKMFPRDQVIGWFLEPSRKRGIIRLEWAVLPNDRGAGQDLVDALTGAGYIVFVTKTTNTAKGRAAMCDSGHDKKHSKPCDDCTRRDLLALAALTNDYFYEPHPNRFHVGSKNESGTLAALVNTELNNLRFAKPPYSPIIGKLPDWLLQAFDGDVAPAAQISICAKAAVAFGRGYKVYRRLAGDHVNGRKSLPYSNIHQNDWDVRLVRDMGKKYFREVRDAEEVPAQVRQSLQGPQAAGLLFPAPEQL